MRLPWWLVLLLIVVSSVQADDAKDAIVKIYTVHDSPDYYNPWSMHGPGQTTGSGCIIKGKRILTNAHVVGDETFIQVRRHGEAKRYQAKVESVSHEADLAVLRVMDESFFDDAPVLEFGELPNVQEEVEAYGFPLGGDTLSITKGVISRIEHQVYVHASAYLLAGQIDAAINPGNSGGPVLKEGKLVGVVMQAIGQADNIGYMVPITIVQHFFKDIEDGHFDGHPSMGVVMQGMENPDLKRNRGMSEDQTGMLVTKVLPGSPAETALREGDVVLRIAGNEVADDGTVEFRPRERTSMAFYVQEHQVGDDLKLDVWRDGKEVAVSMNLGRPASSDLLVPNEEYDTIARYYIFGGVVFVPLTRNLLQAWGGDWYRNAPDTLTAYLSNNFPEKDGEEVVLVLKVLPADINQGYHDVMNWVVREANGHEILNMKELIHAVEESSEPFVTLKNDGGQQLVLDRTNAIASMENILATYQIEADRSADLLVKP